MTSTTNRLLINVDSSELNELWSCAVRQGYLRTFPNRAWSWPEKRRSIAWLAEQKLQEVLKELRGGN